MNTVIPSDSIDAKEPSCDTTVSPALPMLKKGGETPKADSTDSNKGQKAGVVSIYMGKLVDEVKAENGPKDVAKWGVKVRKLMVRSNSLHVSFL